MQFPADSVLRLNGTYEMTLVPGIPYLLRLADTFGGGTVALSVFNQATGGYLPVTGGSWTAYTEQEFRPIHPQVQFTVSGSTAAAISCNLVPLKF